MSKILAAADVKRRHRGAQRKKRPYSDDDLRIDYEIEGRSTRNIAAKYSTRVRVVTRHMVYRDLIRLNIKIRNPGNRKRT